MSETNALNGGQMIVDYLICNNVPYAFGLCGHGNIGFIDALYERQSDIKTISTHHESVSGFMADVYYRVSGQPTATFTSCGPGSANMPIALGNAFLDSVPFLAVTGNVPTSQFNRGAFQELYRHYQADFPSTVRAYCKRVFQPTRGEQMPHTIREAWKTMVTGRPGPVVLDVPFDIFKESTGAETPDPRAWVEGISCKVGADPQGVDKAAKLLMEAERPVVLVGSGCRFGEASKRLIELAEKYRIPVAASASGLGALPAEHELALGLVARNGMYQANQATRQADLILALGVRFDDRTSSSWIPGYSFNIPPTKLIHVDIDPEEIGRNYPVELGLMADTTTFLGQLLDALDKYESGATPQRKAWLSSIDGWRKEWDAFVEPGFKDPASPINPQRAAREIDLAMPDDGILVSDIGIHHNWLIQYCKPKRPDSLIGCMGFGPMGFGVAGVLGAKLAAPERPCVAVVGDGAFFMHNTVLGTAVEYNIPAVWVVWNNYAYASIRGLQRGYLEGRELATDFKHPETGQPYNPDFAAMARSCGVDGVSIDRPKDLADAIRQAIAANRPYVIDANIGAESNPGGAGIWDLPGLGQSKPMFGGRHELG
ncbi:thiamine pyrophosphate-binding protein [Thalassobaculum litoreum]|uniref:Acetolactate synthase-1/2/3 large subunit n=1 Tax=Thalassobaculum litoreum DSM 18839 TaxID=1123362 RepID=A0A8G2BK86_9PROT|nr:thiamine pyrophosphate-binding protein [Thalassobaculum litoreum]SDG17343.1 acetolactate synthase-1/2/3 large subunit [Thalassobaculum litoreum DSM 18839]